VHMLTKEAFNALLKTLEEPPPNVKFIFCTTEPNKVPDTILSRCQRFDFLAIDTASIVSRLEQIVAAEGYEADAEALELIARRAGGSMRDSQSLLDQLLAFGNERFSVDDVHRMLGTAPDDRLLSLIDALLQRQQGRALAELDAALTGGVELGELAVQLLNYFRDLMIVAVGAAEVPFLAVSALCRPDLLRQAQSCGLSMVIAAQEILAETNRRMFRVRYGRSLLESALVRISLLEDLDEIRALLDSPDRNATDAAGGTGNQTPNKPVLPVQPKRSVHASHPEHRNKNPDSTDSPQPSVDFQPGCEEELLSQLQKYADDATRSHLSAVHSLAISGPNQLDLLFPASYHFSRQYCERSGTRGLLEELAVKITGRPIRIAMQTIESDPVDTTEASTAATSKPAHPDRNSLKKKAEQDPFVNDAVSVFEGTLLDARDVANSGPAET
ncbi:MAG: DNA polymerase III subunit gamma/tau, partial [Planctomycetes bacterium]|nr:DNA polymerase III subunit gamma/tau [Planctomycetota bacterium]